MNTKIMLMIMAMMMMMTLMRSGFGQEDKPTYFRILDWYTKARYCGKNLTETIIQVCRDHFAEIQILIDDPTYEPPQQTIKEECCDNEGCSPFEMRAYCDYYQQHQVRPDYTLVEQISESRYNDLRKIPMWVSMTMKCPFTGFRKCLELFESDDDNFPMYHNPYYDRDYLSRGYYP